jgi:hypothetical protein
MQVPVWWGLLPIRSCECLYWTKQQSAGSSKFPEGLGQLSYNISRGSARLGMKPKTWRILTFADVRMTSLVPNPHGNYHWARLILSPLPLSHPPDFRKNILAFCFEVCLGVCIFFDILTFVSGCTSSKNHPG